MINAIIRDIAAREDIKNMATKDDLERLRIMFSDSINRLEARINGFEARINNMEARISGLEGRVGRLEGQMNLFKVFIAFSLPILLRILLKLVFT